MREMKDSGIEWIGEIPKGWCIKRLKFALSEPMKYGAAESGVDYEESLPRYIRITDITSNGELKQEGKLSLSEEQARGYILNTNAILFARSGATVGKAFLYKKEFGRAAFAGYLISAYVDTEIIVPEWILYYTNSVAYWEWVNQIFTQATIQNIGADKYSNMPLPVAPMEKQKKIVQILDRYMIAYDKLVADIQNQITVLEKYKQSIIMETVTSGLNSNIEMKDSEIGWIGKIPAHWNIHPVYYYFAERKNRNTRGKEDNLLSLSYGRVIRKDINANGGLLPENFNAYNIVEEGDIIIRPTDLQNDKRSLRTGLVKEHGIITSAYIDLMPICHVDTRYLHYLLHSYDVMKVFYNMGNGVRQGLNFSEFSRLMVFEPPFEEQVLISNYLDKKIEKIDTLIASKRKQLTVIETYKKMYIYEHVTGKKKV